MREFEHCLRCGQPLRSWFSRREGFGLACWEQTSPADRRRLVMAAAAISEDLEQLQHAGSPSPLADRLRGLLVRPRVLALGRLIRRGRGLDSCS